ncbi:CpsD/CapB family tyrosine-protein kinase [Clostridium saccharobutylicum]|uniref:non-specific protein-tyrosine kinase n=1 Tax=Clostridium saccharobutylicum DSM 13864 TaxID=1345695 RepID=U5MTE5_CLOSA|nr:CpsD/CapB family tyrosine-protein kinase [Clostridium saccharobutylicum]AGX43813.1 capsular exopolysaccharide biosynthesis protein [Clostridium saccharobutylicum DSM 13864]AQR91113.1 tyrosine-protein kinase YwqD [Clostridium saccharobutylicum]AQS01017.1 tyrosine-protein kinase YwqD [Clostridium saccharobutylicum]AQS10756.1 tyrosine-protein kinase YwqD [Clostridium saccharobutylicum]AQS15000.1 tyrosine-protein kinase YwqD [Clostridium saccharobutylicum]
MLVFEDKPKSIDAEAYRTLRTNMQYLSIEKEIKSIVVTSACPSEGKSTVLGNLALAFAQNGKNVIIIDCDLRQPSIHKKFNVSNLLGISQVLIQEETLENAIQHYKSNLDILTSGKIPPNPSEIINSTAMNNLLEELKNKYDILIIDSPPLDVVTDGQILSTKVDGTILVLKAGQSKIQSVKEAKNLLNKVGANIIGLVINQVKESKKKYSYYYGIDKKK